MKLAVDIGNSTIAFGFFEADTEPRYFFKIKKDEIEENSIAYDHIKSQLYSRSIFDKSVDMICICSVAPTITDKIMTILRKFFSCPFKVLEPGVSDLVDCSTVSDELGGDIYANLVASRFRHPAKDILVVDFGTATTIAGVDSLGKVKGVSISCGIWTSLNAICGKAELLDGIMIDKPFFSLGTNTKDALVSGALFSALGMLECCIEHSVSIFKTKPFVVATGGASSFFSKFTNVIDEIYEYNTVFGILKSLNAI